MKVTDILTESIATKQRRNYFIYEAESNWSPGLQASLDANRAELEKTQSAAAEKAQAYKDQQAQLKDKLFQQSAAYNAEMRQQREEEYLARLQRDREEQERQAARTKPGYQQRPSDGQEDGATPEYGQPHGDAANELKMFMAGTKPAAAVGEMDQALWQNIINSGKYVVKQLFGEKGKPASIVIGQPGEEERVEKIAELIQNASDRAHKGDFSAYHNSNYHRWLGRLLGYPAEKIEKFIDEYFSDVKDLAKGRFDEDTDDLEDIKIEETDSEKIGGMEADEFQAAMARLKKLAGAGPLKTVWDPAKRVYRNVPTAVQPAQQPRKK